MPFVRGQSFRVNTILFQVVPVAAHISTALDERYDSLTDGDIFRSRVIVQFLMPLLIKMTRSLRDLVSVHDVEDLISNSLSVSSALANETEHCTEKIWG